VNVTGEKKGRTMNSLIQLKQTTLLFLVVLGLACFGFMWGAQAVMPPPDGCYPNFTTAEGCDALNLLTTGAGNTGLGWRSLFSDSTGSFNTGVGGGALALNNGDSNTAVGAAALLLNTTGTGNTAVGTDALVFNDTGGQNTANGAFALFSNTIGTDNTATGVDALFSNTEGSNNTANGSTALQNNLTGNVNTATGFQALQFNTTGSSNTAVGAFALKSNLDGEVNTAIGNLAMTNNSSGIQNVAAGFDALSSNTNGSKNTAIGFHALVNNTVGSSNIAVGFNGGSNVTGDDNINIGNQGSAGESDTIRIGELQTKTFIAGIRGQTTVFNDAIAVLIDSDGQLGTMSSARRFKTDIKPIDEASASILALKPVSFRYKVHKDSTPQFGLIAEEVAEVNPDLVIYDGDKKPYTVRYEAVNAMLLNEFLKEHRKNEEQEATIARQQKQIEALIAGLQKVSAQLAAASPSDGGLELSKSAPQTVLNDQ
jgi:hypothetical protein